jgi:hypothetical protein
MTETEGVCLSCCPSASTPAVTRLLVRYCRGSAAVGSPQSVRTGLRAPKVFGGEIERRCTNRQQEPTARCRSRSGGPDSILQKSVPREGFQDASVPSLLTKPWTCTTGNSITLHGTMGTDYYILLDVFTSRQGYGELLRITLHM